MPRRESWGRALASAVRFPLVRLAGYPLLVNLEITRRCNAKCDFCRYWHTTREVALDEYVDVVRALRPAAVMFSGGEPLLRRDLEQVIARVRVGCPAVYIGMVTNGALLTVERGLALWQAGLDQLTVSLDFLDARHDAARGIPGLAARIQTVTPKLRRAGVDNLVIQTVIKSDNLDHVADVARWTISNGMQCSLSAYTAVKADNHAHDVAPDQIAALRALVEELIRLKATTGAIASSSYYLKRIPEYFAGGGMTGCLAGRKFLTVSPAGEIQRCSESPVECAWSAWRPRRFGPTDCRACWTSCRGECEAPVDRERIVQIARTCRPRPRSLPPSPAIGLRPAAPVMAQPGGAQARLRPTESFLARAARMLVACGVPVIMAGTGALLPLADGLVDHGLVVASQPVQAPAERCAVERVRRYRLDVRVRPMLFWISRQDVGDGSIAWGRDARGGFCAELLVGSDPDRAPFAVNRWGYIRETVRGAEAEAVGVMSNTDEATPEEARVRIGNDGRGRAYRAVRARLADGRATSAVRTLLLDPRLTLRDVDTVLATVAGLPAARTSALDVTPAIAPGLLTAVGELLRDHARAWTTAHGVAPRLPLAVRYFHAGHLYELRLRSSQLVPDLRVRGRSYGPAVAAGFQTGNLTTGRRTRFDIAFSAQGADAGTPVRISFQPRWWFDADLVLR